MLSHENVLISAHNGNVFDSLGPDEEVIAYLPLAWVGDHIFSYAQSYDAGFCVNCPEAAETVVEDRREIGTTYAFAPPRIYENLHHHHDGADGGCGRAQAAHVRFLHRGGAALGREDSQQGDGAAACARSLSRSASCWSTAR